MATKKGTPGYTVGQTVPCTICGTEFPARMGKNLYCAACASQKRLESKRNSEARKRRAAGIAPIGSEMICADCGAACAKDNGQRLYCDLCSESRRAVYERDAKRKFERANPRVRNSPADKARQKRWSAANRERIRLAAKRYNERNRDAINAKSRASSKTEKKKAWLRAWEAKKMATDPMFVWNKRMKTAVRRALKEAKNGRPWETMVGYSVEELKAHLERQFVKGMSWKNMGEWHIDHRVPLAAHSFETTDCEGFRAAWAITNLQPLWAEVNMKKNDKRDLLL